MVMDDPLKCVSTRWKKVAHDIKKPYKLVRCGHSFCEQCLLHTGNDNQYDYDRHEWIPGWNCPQCGIFSPEGVPDLVLRKVSKEKRTRKEKCHICQKSVGKQANTAYKCTNCRQALCQACRETHKDCGAVEPEQKPTCQLHKKPLNILCHTCVKLICWTCQSTRHWGHGYKTLATTLDTLALHINTATAQLSGLATQMTKLSRMYSACRTKLQNHRNVAGKVNKKELAEEEVQLVEQDRNLQGNLHKVQNQLQLKVSDLKKLKSIIEFYTNKSGLDPNEDLYAHLKQAVYHDSERVKSIRLEITLPSFQITRGPSHRSSNCAGRASCSYKTRTVLLTVNGDLHLEKACEFLCHDLHTMINKTLVSNTIYNTKNFGHSWCNRISYIDEKIWLPCIEKLNDHNSKYFIDVYNESGMIYTTYSRHYLPAECTVIKKMYSGHYIVGSPSGLFQSQDFRDWIPLSHGYISDIAVHGNKFSALSINKPQITTFRLTNNTQSGSRLWQIERQLSIGKRGGLPCDADSTLARCGGCFYVTPSTGGLMAVSDQGRLLPERTPAVLTQATGQSTRICGKDNRGRLLISSFDVDGESRRLVSWDVRERSLEVMWGGWNGGCPQPVRDVVIDSKDNVWLLGGYLLLKLIKYQQEPREGEAVVASVNVNRILA